MKAKISNLFNRFNNSKSGALLGSVFIVILSCFLAIFVLISITGVFSSLIPLLSIKDLPDKEITYVSTMAGSLLGGIFTFFALMITIQFQQKDRKEEKRLSIIPYLNITLLNDKPKDVLFNSNTLSFFHKKDIKDINEFSKREFYLLFENVGLGTSIDVNIDVSSYNMKTSDSKHSLRRSTDSFFNATLFCLSPSNSLYINFQQFTIDDFEEISSTPIKFDFDLKYKDILGNFYNQTICMETIGIDDNGYVWSPSINHVSKPTLIKQFAKTM